MLTFNTNVLFAAAEPMEPTLDYSARIRADGDLIALAARARSYNIVSSIPAVSDETMAALAGWGDENPLPPEYAGPFAAAGHGHGAHPTARRGVDRPSRFALRQGAGH